MHKSPPHARFGEGPILTNEIAYWKSRPINLFKISIKNYVKPKPQIALDWHNRFTYSNYNKTWRASLSISISTSDSWVTICKSNTLLTPVELKKLQGQKGFQTAYEVPMPCNWPAETMNYGHVPDQGKCPQLPFLPFWTKLPHGSSQWPFHWKASPNHLWRRKVPPRTSLTIAFCQPQPSCGATILQDVVELSFAEQKNSKIIKYWANHEIY